MANGFKARNKLLILYMARNICDRPRLGISIGKKCGGAVIRNRLKRRLREVFRQNQDKIPEGFDYLLMMASATKKNPKTDSGKKTDLCDFKKITFKELECSFADLIEQIKEKIS